MSKVIDNIEDIASIDSKAVLTTTQTALDLKANIASPTFTGTVTAPTFIGALNGNATTATSASDATKMPLSGGDFTGLVTTAGNSQTFNSANDTTLSVRSSGTGTPATMSFHRPGAYAVNFGLDTDNVLKVGGWSAGSSYAILHSGNVGSYADSSNKAWVNFNGTGTVSIRSSKNVSSIGDRGVGMYTMNFASALADGNFAFIGVSPYVFDNWYPTHLICYQGNRSSTLAHFDSYAKAGRYDVDGISATVLR